MKTGGILTSFISDIKPAEIFVQQQTVKIPGHRSLLLQEEISMYLKKVSFAKASKYALPCFDIRKMWMAKYLKNFFNLCTFGVQITSDNCSITYIIW